VKIATVIAASSERPKESSSPESESPFDEKAAGAPEHSRRDDEQQR